MRATAWTPQPGQEGLPRRARTARAAPPRRGWRAAMASARASSGCRRRPAAAPRRRASTRPLSPSRTSSRLAGRSDSIGTQPWAMASSTETETESLRRQAQVPARAGVPAGLRGGVEPADETHAVGQARRGGLRVRSAGRSEPSLATTSSAPGQPASDRRQRPAARAAARRSAPARGWRRTGRRPWRPGPAAWPPGRTGRPSPRPRPARACAAAMTCESLVVSAQARSTRRVSQRSSALRCGVTRMSLPQAEPTSRPAHAVQPLRQPGQRAVRGEVVRVDPVGRRPAAASAPAAAGGAAARRCRRRRRAACPAPGAAPAAAARRSPARSRGWTPPTARRRLRRQRPRPLQQVRAVAVADQHVAHGHWPSSEQAG